MFYVTVNFVWMLRLESPMKNSTQAIFLGLLLGWTFQQPLRSLYEQTVMSTHISPLCYICGSNSFLSTGSSNRLGRVLPLVPGLLALSQLCTGVTAPAAVSSFVSLWFHCLGHEALGVPLHKLSYVGSIVSGTAFPLDSPTIVSGCRIPGSRPSALGTLQVLPMFLCYWSKKKKQKTETHLIYVHLKYPLFFCFLYFSVCHLVPAILNPYQNLSCHRFYLRFAWKAWETLSTQEFLIFTSFFYCSFNHCI